MEKEKGDDYIRRIASFIRSKEQRLAENAISKRSSRRHPAPTSVLDWIGLGSAEAAKKPLIFTEDPHHLFYLLMRFESIGIEVGSLDVRVQNPSRPTSMSYLTMLALKDRSDALSITSLRSTISSVSMFSLGGGWFGRSEATSVDADLKYLYSAFTKLPALRVRASGLKTIVELANDPPVDSAIPMDAFKNLQSLECHGIDPRMLLGWDRLSEGLRSLTIKRSDMGDVSDLFIDSVIDDKARREGSPTGITRTRLVQRSPFLKARQASYNVAQLPHSVPEDVEQPDNETDKGPVPIRNLPTYAWSLLAHLSLSDNSLTFLPALPSLPSLSYLDLSSNLLVSIPSSLAALPALKALNLAHNMIDVVLGIYDQIPSIVSLNLGANRLDSLCGLERLQHLARIDLRDNRVVDVDEVGRLSDLQGIKEIWVSGNPCTLREHDWRVRCFDLFAKEGRDIILDGSPAGIMERRAMTYSVDEKAKKKGGNGRPLSTAPSPPVVPVGTSRSYAPLPTIPPAPQSPKGDEGDAAIETSTALPTFPSQAPAQSPGFLPNNATPKGKRRRVKRIVDLDDRDSNDESGREGHKGHSRHTSDIGVVRSRTEQQDLSSPPANPGKPSLFAPNHQRPFIAGTSSMSRASGLTSSLSAGAISSNPSSPAESSVTSSRLRGGVPRTVSAIKANKRRTRISASVYEPADASNIFSDAGNESNGASRDAELFRKRIEALRNEVGDSWLKVLSQTQLATSSEQVVRGMS